MNRFPRVIALVAGLASATGFAPLAFWPVTLIAIAVFVHLVASAPTARTAFGRGWLFGVGHFTLGLNWIAHAFVFQDAMPHWLGYLAVVVLSVYLAVFPAVAGLVAYRMNAASRWQGGFALAAAWVMTEYLRATLFSGFAWDPLGAIWVGTPVASLAILIGTYGLSGLAVLFACMLCLLVRREWLGALRLAAPVALLTLVAVATRSSVPPSVRVATPVVRLVQHNTSQAERHDENHDELSVEALERLTGTPGNVPRLILWPEGAVPFFLEEERFSRDRLARLLGPRDILLTGGDSLIYDRAGNVTAARNSVFAMRTGGDIVSRYDKAHLVPYGEYLPMRSILSAIGLSRLVPGDLDFLAGPGPGTLELPGLGRVGVQICYEITFSGQVLDRANRPDFIFNPSTDAWFGAWGPPQHLAQARLRAIEEGLPVLRSTPTGISAVIDADGRVLHALPRNRAGYIQSNIPRPHAPTAFALCGNMLPLLFALVLALLAVAPRLRRR